MTIATTPFPSPNFNSRMGHPISLILLHYTDMITAEAALARLSDPEAQVSAHYLINKMGNVFQLVDDAHRAWHAGTSAWRNLTDINSHSIGIELDNKGHSFGLEAYPPSQINALISLLEKLTKKHGINPSQVLGHSDVAPSRKIDPGPLFPWKMVHDHGFGIWPKTVTQETSLLEIGEIQESLRTIGYTCPVTGVLDEETQAVITAFQMHFTKEEITGENSPLLSQWIRAVKDTVLSH